MPVTSVTRDPEALTLTVVANFDADVERLWESYLDPRRLEKFWGPPSYPSTFTRHDGAEGGRSEYYMTSPEGTRHYGYWEWVAVEPGRSFEVRDGFADSEGTPNAELPSTRTVFTFAANDASGGSQMTTVTHFESLAELEQLLEMGMEEGMREAMAQIDDVLADLSSFAASNATETQVLSDTQVRISRVVRGTIEQVWRAHHEPELLRKWMLGPDGWELVTCEVASELGEKYRYEWAQTGTDEGRFGFDGELLESMPPHRTVTSEQMIGTDGPSVVNEMTLTPVDGGTLLALLITYPDAEVRDSILATGMTDGMESSYQRLENKVLSPG